MILALSLRKMKKILVLGDSITEGASATNSFGWAQRLAAHMGPENCIVQGVGGDTIHSILNRLDRIPEFEYDLVLLAVGINDSRYRPSLHANEVPLQDYKKGLKEFVDYSRSKYPRTALGFIGLTRVDESRSQSLAEDLAYRLADAELYDNALMDFAAENGVFYFAMPGLADRPELLADGLHPTDKGHQKMLVAILDQLASVGFA